MRISAWSADVFSSDLPAPVRSHRRIFRPRSPPPCDLELYRPGAPQGPDGQGRPDDGRHGCRGTAEGTLSFRIAAWRRVGLTPAAAGAKIPAVNCEIPKRASSGRSAIQA